MLWFILITFIIWYYSLGITSNGNDKDCEKNQGKLKGDDGEVTQKEEYDANPEQYLSGKGNNLKKEGTFISGTFVENRAMPYYY